MEFPQFEFIIKRIFYFFLLLIFEVLKLSFYYELHHKYRYQY